jgi:putative oxidoreductase
VSTFDAAVVILRLGIGLIFAVNGAQKIFGWWGGSGFAGWQAVMVRMGFRPAPLFAAVSAGAELVGGLALAVGFLTPLAAALLVGQSVVIIFGAHWARGFFNRDNGYEFPLALVSGVVAALLLGPGAISLDAVIVAVATTAILFLTSVRRGRRVMGGWHPRFPMPQDGEGPPGR